MTTKHPPSPCAIVDSHCHLDYPALVQDRAGVLARARGAGVVCMVNIATTRRDFEDVRTTAEQHDDVVCSMGVHPHHVHEEGENLSAEQIIALASHPKVVGIGETGLDYFYDTAPKEAQIESFRQHIRAAATLDLPLIIHSREAEADTIRILREEATTTPRAPRGVLHCFSSRRILAEEAVEMGFYVSLSGIITFKKSQELRDIVRDLPLDRLLVETDAPFLAPEPFRGKTCEPAHVVNTAQVLADIMGVSLDTVITTTTANFRALFTKTTVPAWM